MLSCCNEPMKNKVEGHLKYAQMEQDCNVASLLEVVLLIHMSNNIWHARLQLAYCHQQEDETIVQFYQQFMETVDCTVEMYGTIVPSVMVDNDMSSVKIDEKQKKTRENMIVIYSWMELTRASSC
jgi:poly-beta-hydroxyalkanoate depolymerase